MGKLVSCDTENEASHETESGASRDTENAPPAEAFRGEPHARRRSCSLPRPPVGSLARDGDCVRMLRPPA